LPPRSTKRTSRKPKPTREERKDARRVTRLGRSTTHYQPHHASPRSYAYHHTHRGAESLKRVGDLTMLSYL
jgi:hypothetical protein